jgi:hypothetical protein
MRITSKERNHTVKIKPSTLYRKTRENVDVNTLRFD